MFDSSYAVYKSLCARYDRSLAERPLLQSYEAYKAYCHCVSKINPGDEVEVYVKDKDYQIQNFNTGTTMIKSVIAIRCKSRPAIILGSGNSDFAFWPRKDLNPDDLKTAENYKTFLHIFLLRGLHDGLISKVIKNV